MCAMQYRTAGYFPSRSFDFDRENAGRCVRVGENSCSHSERAFRFRFYSESNDLRPSSGSVGIFDKAKR